MKMYISMILAMLVSGCSAPLSYIKHDSFIEGLPVSSAKVKVNNAFTFRPALYAATYPAGEYLPKFEDDEGVYFIAPEQIMAKTVAGGRTMQGGIYISKRSWLIHRAYIDDNGDIHKFDMPANAVIKVTH